MNQTKQPPLPKQKIHRIGIDVLTYFLHIPIYSQDTRHNQPKHGAEISISGDSTAKVQVMVCDNLAKRIAAQMFQKQPDELQSCDITDAINEATSIIAGNIKALLAGNNKASLPVPLSAIQEPSESPPVC